MLPFFLALLLLACASCNQASNWSFDQIQSHRDSSRSSKLTYHASDSRNGIDVEFLRSQGQLKSYLVLHSMPISLKEVPIIYVIDGHSFHSEGYCLKGGQRIRLDGACTTSLLEALAAGKTVALALEGYRGTLTPAGLAAPLKKFEKSSPFPELIHLPF